ncbi:hypothetical protein IQA64_17635 [Leptospira borgpetersenii serovar Tarassovi]|nr:hypothetical protein [Leptospira borgpetersenii serovar Tarassovi]
MRIRQAVSSVPKSNVVFEVQESFSLPQSSLRQNGAPSGLEKRGLDASIYHKTKKPTEGTQ